MKKLLSVSILAMLAVSPMVAGAGTDLTGDALLSQPAAAGENQGVSATANPKYALVGINTDEQQHIASTAYVKGAYNSAIAAINKVSEKAAAVDGKQDELTAGNGIDLDDSTDTISVKLDGNTLTAGADGLKVNSITTTEIASGAMATSNAQGADNTKLTTKGYVDDAVANAALTAGDGVDITSGTVSAKLDGTTLAVGTNGLKVNEITTAEIASTAIETGTTAADNTKLTTKSYVDDAVANAALTAGDGVDITSGTVSVDVGDGVQIDSNGAVAAKLDGTTLAVGVDGLKVNEITTTEIASGAMATGSSQNAVNNKLATQGYVDDAVANAALTAGDGVDITSGTVSAKLDGTTLAVGANGLKVNEITTSEIASGAIATGSSQNAVNNKLATQGYVDDATTGMATTTGVTKTIAATTITVPIYGTWGTDTGNGATTDVTATVTEPTYTLN